MEIQIIGDGVEVDDRIREIVDTKIRLEIEKYLTDVEEDLKRSIVKIEKLAHHGFKVNFDIRLPGSGGHIYSEETGDDLLNVVIALGREVSRQIREYMDRLQSYR